MSSDDFSESIQYLLEYGKKCDLIFVDDFGYDYEFPEPKEKDWNRTKFVSGPDIPPSNSKREKLRAKRKKK